MLAERIYTLRRKHGLSQEQLAEKIGVSRQSISKWESGLSTPELDKLMALSECFRISLDELTKEPAAGGALEENCAQVTKAPSSSTEKKVGIGLCLLGAVCLILSGVLMLVSPRAAEQLNASSAITLNGSGLLLLLCVLSMIAGLILVLRKQ